MNLVSRNGDIIVWEIPARNLSPYTINNVVVTDTSSLGTQYIGHTASKGTFDPITGIWNVGKLLGKESAVLKLTVKVIDITQAPFTNTATGNANQPELDLSNNTYIQTVNTTTCAPACGGSDIDNGCICFNLLDFVTPCTHGETEFELDNIQNGELLGDLPNATISYIDPTLPVLISYTIFCNVGVDRTECSSGTYQIGPILKSKNIFNHTIEQVECGGLTPEQKTVLQDQYPGLVIDDYCWTVIKNGDGTTTSGIPLNCDDTKDTKTTFECVTGDYDPELFENLVTYPENPESGDNHIVLFDNGILIITYNATGENTGDWAVNCFKNYCCGTSTGIQSIVEGNNIIVDNTDPQNPVISANITTLGDDWGTQVIQHSSTSISEGDGTVASPLNVEIYQEVTYAELQTLITNSELIPGKKYLLTDYQTVHLIQGTTDINTGPIEPLLLTASKTNELEEAALSLTYKNDLIYYNALDTTFGATKGFIRRRVDTKKYIDTPLDWRVVKFRRYKFNPQLHVIGNSYLKEEFVIDGGGIIYQARVDTTETPSLSATDWNLIGNNTIYYSLFNTTGTMGSYIYPIDINDYEDVKMLPLTGGTNIIIRCDLNFLNLVIKNAGSGNIYINAPYLMGATINRAVNLNIQAGGINGFVVNATENSNINSININNLFGGVLSRTTITEINDNVIFAVIKDSYLKNIENVFVSNFFSNTIDYIRDLYVKQFNDNVLQKIDNVNFKIIYHNTNGIIIDSIGIAFTYNLNTISFNGINDFTSATHAQSGYTKTWYYTTNGQLRLEYRDNTDTLVTDLVTN